MKFVFGDEEVGASINAVEEKERRLRSIVFVALIAALAIGCSPTDNSDPEIAELYAKAEAQGVVFATEEDLDDGDDVEEGEMEGEEPEVASVEEEAETPPEKKGKVRDNPKSTLGKIMKKAEDTIATAEDRAKVGIEVVESTAEKAVTETPEAAKPAAEAVEKTMEEPEKAVRKPGQAPSYIMISSIFGTEKRRTAMLKSAGKNYTVMKGDATSLATPSGGFLDVKVIDVTDKSVELQISGQEKTVTIFR